MTTEKQLQVLKERYWKHSLRWDCYNDCPTDEIHLKEIIILYCSDMIRELSRYMNKDNGNIKYWRDVKKLAKES